MVNLHGMHGDHPSNEPNEFASFEGRVPITDMSDVLEGRERVTEKIDPPYSVASAIIPRTT